MSTRCQLFILDMEAQKNLEVKKCPNKRIGFSEIHSEGRRGRSCGDGCPQRKCNWRCRGQGRLGTPWRFGGFNFRDTTFRARFHVYRFWHVRLQLVFSHPISGSNFGGWWCHNITFWLFRWWQFFLNLRCVFVSMLWTSAYSFLNHTHALICNLENDHTSFFRL